MRWLMYILKFIVKYVHLIFSFVVKAWNEDLEGGNKIKNTLMDMEKDIERKTAKMRGIEIDITDLSKPSCIECVHFKPDKYLESGTQYCKAFQEHPIDQVDNCHYYRTSLKYLFEDITYDTRQLKQLLHLLMSRFFS